MSRELDFSKDIPDLDGKVVLITGGTAGLGKAMLSILANRNPNHLVFTGRSKTRAEKVISEIRSVHPNQKISFIECDLASLDSVRAAGAKFNELSPLRLDILILNAGIMAVPPGLTADGYEIQFGTNYLGHALLAKLLLPALQRTAANFPTAPPRVVTLTSLGFQFAPSDGIQFNRLTTVQDDFWLAGPWYRYGQSKLANVLFAKEFANRYPEITSVAVHPGVIETDLVSSLPFGKRMFVYATNYSKMVSLEEGIKSPIWAATAGQEELVNGEFYEPIGKIGTNTAYSKDPSLARMLWEWTDSAIA